MSLWAVACGARSGLIVDDNSTFFPEGPSDLGAGASNPGQSGGGGAPGAGAAPSIGGAPGVGAAPDVGGGPMGAGGSGASEPWTPSPTGGGPTFGDHEPEVVEQGTYPERALLPDLALAMTRSGEAAVLFFTSESAHIGQGRWFGEEWKPEHEGTEVGVHGVKRAWIREDGLLSWVSYAVESGTPPLSSEVFSGGLPMGFSTSFEEFRLPLGPGNFEAPPSDIILGPSGNAVAAELSSRQFQYTVDDVSALGDDHGAPCALAAGETGVSSLYSVGDQLLWDDARYDGDLFLHPTRVDGAAQGEPDRVFLPVGLAYTDDDVAWGAWKVVEPGNTATFPYLRAGELSPDGDHELWDLYVVSAAPFAYGGGLAVTPDGNTAVVLWGYLPSTQASPAGSHARMAWIKDNLLIEGTTHDFLTTSSCRIGPPSLAGSGEQVIASAHCSDGSGFLFGLDWLVRLPGKVAGLPAVAIDESGAVALAAWTERDGATDRYRIQLRTLTW